MKILLTTLNSKYVHTNLAIRYLRTYCQNLPVQIQIKEFNINQNLDYILAEIYKTGADMIGFSCYIWNIIPTLQLCTSLKQICPQTQIILGGPEVSYDPGQLLKENHSLDYIVSGEGEVTFHQLVRKLLAEKEIIDRSNERQEPIPGLSYRQESGEIVVEPERPFLENLDQIPSPFLEGLADYENKLVYYESSRGCPFNCQYCLSSTFKGVRTFSMERIQEDLLRLIQAGVKKVKFVDRTFNFRSEHALAIMKFLVEHQGETSFHFEMTAHLITEEMLDFLDQVPAGLFQFEIGVQTTHIPTLEKIRRADDFERLARVVKRLSVSQNIHLHLDLIAGLPGEDYQRFQKSFNQVFLLQPDNLQLGFLKLLKGSGIRKNKDDYGYRFIQDPPYEVLGNNLVRYDELLELKMVEDLLETFYNSHKFSASVDFIIARWYPTDPYRFFLDLKRMWEKRGFYHAPQKDITLYKFLLDFYQQKLKKDVEIFREYIKFDFLQTLRRTHLPEWLHEVKVPDYKERCYQFVHDRERLDKTLPHLADVEGKQILRRILIEPFAFDLFQYQKQGYQGQLPQKNMFILFDYQRRDPIFQRVQYQIVEI